MEIIPEKKSFVLHYSIANKIRLLNAEQVEALFYAILSTGGVCEKPGLDPLTEMAFLDIEREIAESNNRWKMSKEEAGRKGGLKKAENARLRQENEALKAQLTVLQGGGKGADLSSNAPSNSSMLAVDVDVDADAVVDDDVVVDVDEDVVADADGDVVCVDPNAGRERGTVEKSGKYCAADAAPHAHAASQKSASASLSKEEAAHFEALWKLYPLKRGKNQVSAKTKRALMAVSVEEMAQAIERYMEEVKASPADRQLLNGSTWFNGRYKDYLGDDYTPAPQIAGTKQPPKPSARAQQLDAGYAPGEKESREEYLAKREE